MKKRIVRFMALCFCCCMLFTGVSAKADTIDFDVTVNKSTTNVDPLSRKALKNTDGDNYFYVRPTYFSATGNIKVRSVNHTSPSIRSKYYTISSGSVNVVKKYAYGSNVPGGQNYYMESDFGAATISTMRMKGKYTP